MRARMLTCLLLASFGTALLAQGPPRPQRPAQPRDSATAAAPKGTAILKGRVITADGQAPLRRATIRVSGSSLPQALVTSTNSEGVYVLREVPAGRYVVSAQRSGYLTLQNGQRYPDEAGMPVEVRDGAEVEIDFALPRVSVISGRILDETGDVVPGATVWAMQPRWFRQERRLVAISSARTDDTGQYRITPLAPGDYEIMTLVRETWTVTRDGEKQIFGYAPTYYPSTADRAQAQRVQVAIGQEAGAIDITLVPSRTASVSGTALDASGAPLAGATVNLGQAVEGPSSGIFWNMSARVAADGSWTIRDVAPGDYTLGVQPERAQPLLNRASMPLSVRGADMTGILVTPDVPVSISGTVVTDNGEPLPGSPGVRVMPQSIGPGRAPPTALSGDDAGMVGPDGRFTYDKALPGPALLRVTGLPSGWGVKSVALFGRDHTEVPFEVRAGQPIGDARIVLSRTFPQVTGTTVDDQGQAVQATVLLFPLDPARWHEAAGTLRHARPDQYGSFRFDNVRPGEYYVIALDYVQTWQASDPGFLDTVRKRATRVEIVEGENEPLTVRVQR